MRNAYNFLIYTTNKSQMDGYKQGHLYFASESVGEGHPDKLCDQVSDGILDACLKVDPNARVAMETATKTGMVSIGVSAKLKSFAWTFKKMKNSNIFVIGCLTWRDFHQC